jgi:hypothetical protein
MRLHRRKAAPVRFKVALSAALAAIGALLLVLFWHGERRPAPLECDEGIPAVGGALHGSAELAAAPGPVEESSSREAAAVESTPAMDGGASPESSRWVELVEVETLRPVPGAEVRYREPQGRWSPLAFERLKENAQHAQADERGRIQIPWPEGKDVFLLAWSPGRAGGGNIPSPRAPDEVSRLELYPDWDVVAAVVDASGRPAPRVRIEMGRGAGSEAPAAALETDAGGRACFQHAGLELGLSNLAEILLSVDLPLSERLGQRIEGEAPPAEPIRFQLPPMGAVEARVLDAGRAPVTDGTAVELGLVRPGEARDVSPFSRHGRTRLSRPTAGGKASFEYVELGAEVELLVRSATSGVSSTDFFSGPRVAGQRVEHMLVLGLNHPVLAFRAVDETGRPLAKEKLALRAQFRSTFIIHADQSDVTTDEQGSFTFDLESRFLEGDRRTLLVTALGGALGVEVDLSRAFGPGTNPMGDLVLLAPPLVVGGRVLDASGQPVEGAELRFELPVRDREDNDQVLYWSEARFRARSEAAGNYAVRDFTDETVVRVSARKDRQRSAAVETAVGTADLAIALEATGSVAGSVRLDPDMPADALEVKLLPGGLVPRQGAAMSPGSWDRRHRASLEPDGTFRLDERPAGRYGFTLGVKDQDPLVELDAVDVVAGQESRDPRLEGIDLRSRLFVARLTLVLPDARTGELQGNAILRPSGKNGTAEERHWFRASPVVLVSPHDPIDVRLVVSGYRTESLEAVRGDREVRLRPALSARLVLPPSIELPRPPNYVKAVLGPAEDDSTFDWGGSAFDESREIRCLAPEPGRMKVRWILERRAGGGASATTIDLEPAQFVELEDISVEQRFELEVSSEALAKVLAQPPF